MAKIIRLMLVICIVAFGMAACGKDDQPGNTKKSGADGSQKVSVPKQQAPQPNVEKPETAKPAASPVPAQAIQSQSGDSVEQAGSSGETAGATKEGAAIETPENPDDSYNPIGKVDPFKPLIKDKQIAVAAPGAGAGKTEKPKRAHVTPLEKVDLSQLKLDGIILASSGNRAMISDATGKGYVVTVGTYMGIYSGRVVEILADRIVVEEEVENIFGKISLRRREMNMQKPLGE